MALSTVDSISEKTRTYKVGSMKKKRQHRNLKHFTSNQSRDEAVKNGRLGGIESGRARRRKIEFSKILRALGELPAANATDLAAEFPGLVPEDVTNRVAMGIALFKKALDGETKATETILRLTSDNLTFECAETFPRFENPFQQQEKVFISTNAP